MSCPVGFLHLPLNPFPKSSFVGVGKVLGTFLLPVGGRHGKKGWKDKSFQTMKPPSPQRLAPQRTHLWTEILASQSFLRRENGVHNIILIPITANSH